jgi:PLP dependent protein
MTIGALSESLASADKPNRDFECLVETRDMLHTVLRSAGVLQESWGDGGRLLLSMGMSSDFEAALRAGSDVVRVGTGIFGTRHQKGELPTFK